MYLKGNLLLPVRIFGCLNVYEQSGMLIGLLATDQFSTSTFYDKLLLNES